MKQNLQLIPQRIRATMALTSLTVAAAFAGVLPDKSVTLIAPDGTVRSSKVANLRNADPISFDGRTRAPQAKAPEGLIQDAPDGNTVVYGGSGYSVMWMGNTAGLVPTDGAATTLTTTDAGEVYWKDPFFGLPTDTYLKGEEKDGAISFSLPQPILYMDGTTYMAYSLKQVDYEDSSWFIADEENTSISLVLDPETGCYSQVGENMLGICTPNGEWQLVGQIEMLLTPFDKEPVYMPADVQSEEWIMKYNFDDSDFSALYCNVGSDGKYVYISGLFPLDREACIKAEIQDDNKISFVSEDTYLGNGSGYFFYAYGGKREVNRTEDEEGNVSINISIMFQDDATFAYDPVARTITPIQDGQIIMITSGITWPIEQYEQISFYDQGKIEDFTPAAPKILNYFAFNEVEGMLIIDIPAKNNDDQFLNVDKLSYELKLNGEIFTFDPEFYWNFEQPMTRIPYLFSDGNDIYGSGSTRYITFYISDPQSFSLTSYYSNNGEMFASPTAEFNVSGVGETKAGSVVSTYWVDLTGRKLNEAPTSGIAIRIDTMDDGTRRAIKTMR